MAMLRLHVTELAGAAADSDLLFPSKRGGFRSRSCLDKPFREVAAAIGLTYRVSPKAMRRTCQNLMRAAASVKDVVTRSISGHATEAMQHHYSTVADQEQREALARLTEIMSRGGGSNGGKEP